ncbi:MAG: hypothetical protein SwBeaMacB_13850 [Shewanella algae]|uniref:DUF2523 family protein n=1 Tax=Shewanella algae TaxID=38313 RepID=UPI003005D408
MLDWLAQKWNEFVDLLYMLFLSWVDFYTDYLFWILDTLFQAIIFILGTFGDLFQGLNPMQYISAIPPETQYFLAICGFNDAMSMIVSSLIIRFMLQLIPFVRLGS